MWDGLRPSTFFCSSPPCLVLWEGRLTTLLFLTLSSVLLKTMNAIRLASICPCKAGKLMFLGRPLASLLLIVLLLKAVHVIGLVPTCRCKGGRFMAFRKAFGIVTCPLLFFTLPRSLGRPAYYSSLLDLVFFSYEDCECHTASTYMSLQGWQADVFRQALSLSSAYCASSEGCNRDRASIYICHLSSYIFFGRPSAWYSSLLDLVFFSSEGCECDRARNYIYMCRCKGG